MKIPKELEDYLTATEREAKKMMRAFKEPIKSASTNDYHRGRFRTVCEVREIFESIKSNRRTE